MLGAKRFGTQLLRNDVSLKTSLHFLSWEVVDGFVCVGRSPHLSGILGCT